MMGTATWCFVFVALCATANALRPRDYKEELSPHEEFASYLESNASSGDARALLNLRPRPVYSEEECTKKVAAYKQKCGSRTGPLGSRRAVDSAFWMPGDTLDSPVNTPSIYESAVWEEFKKHAQLLMKYQKKTTSTTWSNLIGTIDKLITSTQRLESFVSHIGTAPLLRQKTSSGIPIIPIGLHGFGRQYYGRSVSVDDLIEPKEHDTESAVTDKDLILKIYDTFLWRLDDPDLGAPFDFGSTEEPRRTPGYPATYAGDIPFLIDELAGYLKTAIEVSTSKSKYGKAWEGYWFSEEKLIPVKAKIIREEDEFAAYRGGGNIAPVLDRLNELARAKVRASREYTNEQRTWGDANGGAPLPGFIDEYWMNVFKLIFQGGRRVEMGLWVTFWDGGLPRMLKDDEDVPDTSTKEEKWWLTITNAMNALAPHFEHIYYIDDFKFNGPDLTRIYPVGALRIYMQENFEECTNGFLGLL